MTQEEDAQARLNEEQKKLDDLRERRRRLRPYRGSSRKVDRELEYLDRRLEH